MRSNRPVTAAARWKSGQAIEAWSAVPKRLRKRCADAQGEKAPLRSRARIRLKIRCRTNRSMSVLRDRALRALVVRVDVRLDAAFFAGAPRRADSLRSQRALRRSSSPVARLEQKLRRELDLPR